ncbi:EAL domain-containing protein (putative c-di-GMP-specific phosphodiesterase class I) [Humitalea rosea]|uniref:EAL domain-containing protein (Putative c-di-GMP-specific phosphodiesterase class I) n=1 Tax=Humitalea rosea TaxID=990373 RepID=A0A2W7IP96_9PROT|nr:EAL domain-containing protein [Humitalea rosea]PZW49047.1 EAL domain-containing protein (putative c-di-GMP-specific phosphodiesterase class I) [Humitalea rosea]
MSPGEGARERFVAFAFAASECLIETDPLGRILFAVGAFRSRFGCEAEALVGRPIATLLAPEEQGLIATAIPMLALRGRLPPSVVNLAAGPAAPSAGPVSSQAVLSGLALPGQDGQFRLCLTLGTVPLGLAPIQAANGNGPAPQAAGLLRAAEARLQAGSAGRLGLFEITGPAAERLARGDPILNGALATALQAGPGTLAGSVAPGRFGLMQGGEAPLPLGESAAAMTRVLEQSGVSGQIKSLELLLTHDGMNEAQAVRALRHALGAFTRGGASGLAAAGMGDGLQAFLDLVAKRRGGYRRTIAERRFRLDYQPICRLADRQIHHFEALLRLDGAGSAGVGEFVNLVEGAGLSEELDLAVAAVAAEASRDGPSIAFNISGYSAQSPHFRAALLALLDRARVPAGRMLIELTESAEVEDEDEAAITIAALRARGVAACIDDFGAGAASFRYLRAFRVDYVKLDGSFVQAAATQERERSFLASMLDLARTVGAQTVAERIETEEDAARMLALGVDFGQGWLFGRPGKLPGPAAPKQRRAIGHEVWR